MRKLLLLIPMLSFAMSNAANATWRNILNGTITKDGLRPPSRWSTLSVTAMPNQFVVKVMRNITRKYRFTKMMSMRVPPESFSFQGLRLWQLRNGADIIIREQVGDILVAHVFFKEDRVPGTKSADKPYTYDLNYEVKRLPRFFRQK